MLGALVMDVTYGIRVRSSDDPYINLVEAAMHGFSIATIPGTFLVVSPWLSFSYKNIDTQFSGHYSRVEIRAELDAWCRV
jgi:hypothetical protein